MKALHYITFVLLVVGGLNWLFVAFNWNLINTLFGNWPTLETIIYVLVGLSAAWHIFSHGIYCRTCKPQSAVPMGQQ